MCAIDYQAGTINISGLFDVHNFVAASAFSGMNVSLGSLNIIKVEDYVAEVYNNNPSYVDSNSKANIAIAMVMRTKSESYATVNFVGGTANGSVALPSSSGLTYERLAYSKRVLFFSTYYNYFFATKASALSSTTQPAIEKITRSA